MSGKRVVEFVVVVAIVGVLAALLLPALSVSMSKAERVAAMVDLKSQADEIEGRMMVWTASLSIEVGNVAKTAAAIAQKAQKNGGYVLARNEHSQKSASLTLRIPAGQLTNTLSDVATLGKVTGRRVSCEDVTASYIDNEARLKNNIALRDRLRQLLDKATEVKDILEIEKELTRVQSDVDSLDGRLKKLKGDVDYATVQVQINQSRILGPLGWILKWLWWIVKKLFVIRG